MSDLFQALLPLVIGALIAGVILIGEQRHRRRRDNDETRRHLLQRDGRKGWRDAG